jgi:hypothetical protein
VPLSKIDSLPEALDVFEERTALWESIGAWEELVWTWLSEPLLDLDKEQVLSSWCHAAASSMRIVPIPMLSAAVANGARTFAPFSCAWLPRLLTVVRVYRANHSP